MTPPKPPNTNAIIESATDEKNGSRPRQAADPVEETACAFHASGDFERGDDGERRHETRIRRHTW